MLCVLCDLFSCFYYMFVQSFFLRMNRFLADVLWDSETQMMYIWTMCLRTEVATAIKASRFKRQPANILAFKCYAICYFTVFSPPKLYTCEVTILYVYNLLRPMTFFCMTLKYILEQLYIYRLSNIFDRGTSFSRTLINLTFGAIELLQLVKM